MANATTNSKGTRLAYHATNTTLMAAQTAAAAVPSGWVQVLNVQDIDVMKNVIESYDDGDLEDTREKPAQIVKPGKITFSKKKNTDTSGQSVILQGFVDGSTRYAWAVIYIDGTVIQTKTTVSGYEGGRLVCTSAGKASNGDLKAKPIETFEVQALEQLVVIEHA